MPSASSVSPGRMIDLLDGDRAREAERARHRQRARRPLAVQASASPRCARVPGSRRTRDRARARALAPDQVERLRRGELVDQLAARGQVLDDPQPPVDAGLAGDRRRAATPVRRLGPRLEADRGAAQSARLAAHRAARSGRRPVAAVPAPLERTPRACGTASCGRAPAAAPRASCCPPRPPAPA